MGGREGRAGREGGEGREMAQWRPFGDVESWLGPWEGLFPRRRFFDDMLRDFGSARRNFVPAVELSENDESYSITVELPGVKKDDVHVDLREGMLVVQGEKRCEREEKKERGRYLERTYGSFCRTFTLPNDADTDALKASFKDGVLTIQVPRSEESKPREIAIQSDSSS
jgi:HSP20 family protein